MDDLLSKYSGNFKTFKKGDKVEGTIVEIADDRVIVDIDRKSVV